MNMNKLIFLGTGAAVSVTRQLTSICFVVDGKAIMIDCGDGMGTVRNLKQANIPLENLNDIFVTHRHADHILGMPQILFTKLFADEKSKVRVFGPRQAIGVVRDISFKTHDYLKIHKHRIGFVPLKSGEEVRLEKGLLIRGVKVSGSDSNTIAFAYSLMIEDKKIVFTSDMKPNKAFTKLAIDADIVIHECFGLEKDADLAHSYGHSTARDAGELAITVKAKQLILTHLRDAHIVSPQELVDEAKKYFNGKITVAEDLMEVTL